MHQNLFFIAIRLKKKKSNKTVNTYLSAIQFVAGRYKTQKICVEAVDTCFLVFDSVSDQ